MTDLDLTAPPGSPAKHRISKSEAARILGCTRAAVTRLVAEGALSSLALPGCHPRLRQDEVEALAEKHLSPAGRI